MGQRKVGWASDCRGQSSQEYYAVRSWQRLMTGRIVQDEEFAAAVAGVLGDPVNHAEMRQAARAYALTMSWDAVFEGVYKGYETILSQRELAAE